METDDERWERIIEWRERCRRENLTHPKHDGDHNEDVLWLIDQLSTAKEERGGARSS